MNKPRLNSKLTYENPFVLCCHSIVHAPLPSASPVPPPSPPAAHSIPPMVRLAGRSRRAMLLSMRPMRRRRRVKMPAGAMHRAPVAAAGYRSDRIRRRWTCVVYPGGQWMRQGAAGCCLLDVTLPLPLPLPLLLLPLLLRRAASLGQVAGCRVLSGLVYCPLQCSFGRGCGYGRGKFRCRSTVAFDLAASLSPLPPSVSAAKEVYEKSIKKVFNQSHCLG